MTAKQFRKLEAYSGPLTVEQTAEGIEAALNNARFLVADAELLLERNRWPRAASLSILSIEESGKIGLLRSLLLTDSPEERKKLWRDYRSHTKKNYMGAFFDYVTEWPHIEDFRGLFDSSRDHPQILDALKQIGFYSDCLGNAHWSVPSGVIDEQVARQLFATAKLAAPETPPPFTTTAELRLWVKHIKPVWKTDMLAMKQALIRCYQEGSELGVLGGQNTVEDVVKFLL